MKSNKNTTLGRLYILPNYVRRQCSCCYFVRYRHPIFFDGSYGLMANAHSTFHFDFFALLFVIFLNFESLFLAARLFFIFYYFWVRFNSVAEYIVFKLVWRVISVFFLSLALFFLILVREAICHDIFKKIMTSMNDSNVLAKCVIASTRKVTFTAFNITTIFFSRNG